MSLYHILILKMAQLERVNSLILVQITLFINGFKAKPFDVKRVLSGQCFGANNVYVFCTVLYLNMTGKGEEYN